MADEGEQKLVLKPGSVTMYLTNFTRTNDSENFQFSDLILQNKRVETLAKTMDEVKDARRCDLSVNNIQDVAPLKDMQQLMYLNLSKNKIKALNILT